MAKRRKKFQNCYTRRRKFRPWMVLASLAAVLYFRSWLSRRSEEQTTSVFPNKKQWIQESEGCRKLQAKCRTLFPGSDTCATLGNGWRLGTNQTFSWWRNLSCKSTSSQSHGPYGRPSDSFAGDSHYPADKTTESEDNSLDYENLKKIAYAFGPFWKELGKKIGIEVTVLNSFKENLTLEESEHIVDSMLQLWTHKFPHPATRCKLADYLLTVHSDTACKVISELVKATDSDSRRNNSISVLRQLHPAKNSKSNEDTSSQKSEQTLNYELRHDQRRNEMLTYNDKDVFVCAPLWVLEGIKKLESVLNRVKYLSVHDKKTDLWDHLSSPFQTKDLPLTKFSDLVKLQLLSRNEASNVDGVIRIPYESQGINESVFLSLKDLVRQTVIVGEAETTHYGGYRSARESQTTKVLICDMAALQFQQNYNSGRLVLLKETALPSGLLDNLIYESVVGEPKPSYQDAHRNTQRFVPVYSRIFGDVLFDTFAYVQFVAQDVVLAGLALDHVANIKGLNLHFKFLKYGTGFFAADFSRTLDKYILQGVIEGLETLLRDHKHCCIKVIELPFYTNTAPKKVKQLQDQFGITVKFSMDDALMASHESGLTIATTNCADPHTVLGNEMGHSSVDASIAENLKDKGNKFSPIMNGEMRELYFTNISKLYICDT